MNIETILTPKQIKFYESKKFWADMTIGDYLEQSISKYPNKIAVVDSKGRRCTYQELGKVATRLSLGLSKMGIRKGDIVSVQLPNWIYFSYVYLALAKLGAIINPIVATYRHKEVNYILSFSESKALFIPDEFRGFDYIKMIEELRPHLPALQNIFVVGESVPKGMISFREFLQTKWEEEQNLAEIGKHEGPTANDILALKYTSGTEAEPKGVLHTHNTIIFGEKTLAQALHITHNDAFFMPSPVAHATGFAHGVTLPILVGGRSVLLDIWEPEEALKMIQKERCTCAMGATPFVRMLLDCPNLLKYDLKSLRFFISGGAPIPREMVVEAEKIGLKVLACYGSTESIPHAVNRLDDSPEKIYGTDGKPCPGVEVKIVDESRKELARGEVGEEASRGPNVFVGYFKQPGITKKSFDSEGWFYSGDFCRLDKDGYITVEGRKKDIIIRGGENISVKEVEDLLHIHPNIYNVAIVAMPDPKMGEKMCAYVIPKQGKNFTFEEMVSFLLEKKVAKFKLPERLEIIKQFPMTPSGKIQKYLLRKDISEKLELKNKSADLLKNKQ